jgi:hypothetical protein
MSFKTDLMAYLRDDAGLSGLVGDRIRFDWMKQNAAYPYVTLTRIDDVGHHHATAAAKIRSPRYQIDVWALNNEDRAAVSEALANALDGLRGTVGSTDVRSVQVQDHGRDLTEPPKDARGKAIYRTSMDVIFWYAPEAVPSP